MMTLPLFWIRASDADAQQEIVGRDAEGFVYPLDRWCA
jgi:hypothetical protein